LIARRVRELGVYSEIYACDVDPGAIKRFAPKAIILSGGPESVYDASRVRGAAGVFDLGVPVLGICYGMQTMAAQLGGRSNRRSTGNSAPRRSGRSPDRGCSTAWKTIAMPRPARARCVDEPRRSRRAVPPGFKVIGASDNAPLAAMADESRRFYACSFIPR
jgi:GMP synthase (glutamine-hydrolysing)